MRRAVTVAMLTAIGFAGTAYAGDPTIDRQTMMKNLGAATGAGAAMIKGEAEYDPVTAQLVLRTMHNTALGFPLMFPEGSETGNDTEALPVIWEDKAGFDAIAAKLADATSVQVTDMDSFKAAFGAATQNCGACHKTYRVMKN